MKQKRLVALLLVLAMLFAVVTVIAACDKHECKHVCETCGKCTDATCTDPACKDKCPGHETAHVCGHVCPTCGKCTDSTCTDPVCADKCEGHQTVDPDKGKTKDNPLTPDEAIALMKQAGSGVVVGAAEKQQYYIQGVVNAGSTVDTQYHEWTFTLGTGTDKVSCQATIDSSVTNKPSETNGALDGATVIIHGFLELYSGRYQCSYLPASASPTGNKFTPSLVEITIPVGEVESVSIMNGIDYANSTAYLLPIEGNSISFSAKVNPSNAPQDIVWSVTNGDVATVTANDTTEEAPASAQVTYKGQTGSVTLTATAKGTNISATVTVEFRDVHGGKESDPLTVDEAIAIMEAKPGEYLNADDRGHGYYIQGTVASGSTVAGSGTWSFTLAGTDNKSIDCSVEGSKLNGIKIPNMAGGLDGCQILLYAERITYVNDAHTAKGNTNELKSCTFPALTAIEIEAEQTEVTIPNSVEITVKSITPANAVFENVEWLTSDETKATVTGDESKATVTAVAAGEVKISVRYANITSNEITLNVSQEQQAIKATYDWTDKLTADTVCNNTYYHYNLPNDTDILSSYINVWTPGQTEITEFKTKNAFEAGEEGKGIGYFAHPRRDNSCTISIVTQHQIKKFTLKLIPYSDATTIQFSVNGQPYQKDKTDQDNWDGKVSSAFEVSFEFNQATQNIELSTVWTTGNNFAIVGITFETEATSSMADVLDWTDKLTADTVCNNTYYHYNLPNDTDILSSYINVWTPGQTEITEFKTKNAFEAGEEGKGIGYFAHPRRDNSCTISIVTQHQIKKFTLKLIPYSDATTIQFSVNGQPYQKDKTDQDTWDGKVSSAFEVSFEFSEATQNIELSTVWTTGNNFAIVGMTLEW